MSQPGAPRPRKVGLFLNSVPARRVQFQADCGAPFDHLFLAADADEAERVLATENVDLLVIDLDRFDRGIDLAPLGKLVRQRAGKPVLLLCAYGCGSWLTDLMRFGPLDYVMAPAGAQLVNERIASHFAARDAHAAPSRDEAGELRALLTLRSDVLDAVAGVDDGAELAGAVCVALARWPCVIHAAMFEVNPRGELVLAAQESAAGIDLTRLPGLDAGTALLESPLRQWFPALIAACGGELAWLDDPGKCGDAALAAGLKEMGAAMALGVPIRARGPGAPLGAINLMFDRARHLSLDELDTLDALSRQVGLGLRMAEMARDGETLLARLTDLATTDALTGVANRRRGEALLEQEIKRARRYGTPLSLITIDVDHFKAINDRYGHPVGDAALRVLAQAMRAELRSSDWLARSGGDEFQIVVTHTNAIDGLKMAEKIRQAVAATVFPGFDRLSVSMAVAQAGADESADALMVRSAAALARAKRAGRNCVELAMQ
jgi:diguanylate cyclase (GGDEF)-like protein